MRLRLCWLAVPRLHAPLPSERHERSTRPFPCQFTMPANPPCLPALACLCFLYMPAFNRYICLCSRPAGTTNFSVQFTNLQAQSVKCTDAYWVT